jgi:hypothetical protein
MPRPSDEGRSDALKVRIAPSEMKALDDWCDREDRSRSDGVRRGLQLLLANDKGAKK